jgi:DNA repair exonuclease SbcCD ATPase subunit
MTNDQNRTDLAVAKDLENLTEVIDNSLKGANEILRQAKEVEEIRILISEIHTSRDQLIESQREAREIGDQLSQRLEYLQTLETNIRQLDAQVSRNLEAVESCGNLIDELTQAKRELEEIGVTSLVEQARLILEDIDNVIYLENYLQDFGRVRNHKQLRQFLRQELGFIGLIVYVLHLLTRNRKR